MHLNSRGAPRGDPSRGTSRSIPAAPTAGANPVFAARRGGGPNQRNELCRFLLRGGCKFATTCQYSHNITRTEGNIDARPPSGRQALTSTQTPSTVQATIASFPGLANDQFSKVEINLTPGQTFHSLRNYLEDSFRFRTPSQVYHFLNVICCANAQNSSWTATEGQVHLHELVQGNGIVRLADTIRLPKDTTWHWSFQRGYIPIFVYMTSDWVVKSTLNSDINALYGLFHNNFQIIRNTVETNMRNLMAARSFKDGSRSFSGKQIFKVLFVALFEYLTRFKEAPVTNPGVRDLVEQIVEWFDQWLVALGSIPPFEDECTTCDEAEREFIVENLRRDKERVLRIIRRGQTVVLNGHAQMSYRLLEKADPGLVAILERNFDFDGPGEFCETGPRHDNDHVDIEMIRVAPTRDELLCEDEPYLPANFFEAPHFHDPRSVERLLDIQFRLLREELTSPIRLAVHLIVEDLKKSKSGATALSKILNSHGGRYAAPATAQESVMFSVFTDIAFQPPELSNRGISVGIEFDTPPGRARSVQPGARAEYWEQVSKKRLMQDGLVALIWKDHIGNIDVYVGTVASSGRDLVDRAKANGGQARVAIRVSFFDAKANIRIVQALQSRHESNDVRVLIEAPVFYEGIRPFLEALKREPELLPFSQYLSLQSKEELRKTVISPPLYSRTPGFFFELKDLFPKAAGVESLQLITRDPDSIANARTQLIQASRLDPSQAEAVIDSLTREVALIQGPPGTGKSYTGLELIRVLVKSDVFPILLVAFTNHALDHMLNGVLDSGITKKIVRLGSCFSMDKRLSKYSLEEIEKDSGRSRLEYSGKSAYREMKELESQMNALMDAITSHRVPSSHIEQHISLAYPHHHGELFRHPPSWISAIAPKPSDAEGGWKIAGESPKQEQSIIDFWLKGGNFKFLETPPQKGAKAKAPNSNTFGVLGAGNGDGGTRATRQNFLQNFMREHGLKNVPKIPTTSRALEALLKSPKVWSMSRNERVVLHEAWSLEASDLTNASQIQNFEEFRQSHNDASEIHKEITEQIYTGLEIIWVLIQNKITPILLVTSTNHALNHMHNGVLDAKITNKIIWRGSQSSVDEWLLKYMLDNIERDENELQLENSAKSVYCDMKILQSWMTELMHNISSCKVPLKYIEQQISSAYPHHHREFFYHIPDWIKAIPLKLSDAEKDQDQDQYIIDFWLNTSDLQFVETHQTSSRDATSKAVPQISGTNLFNLLLDTSSDNGSSIAKGQNFLQNFMHEHDLKDTPKIPMTNRPIDILLKNLKVWNMSWEDQVELHKAWSTEATGLMHSSQIQDFADFRQMHKETTSHHKEIMDQLKANILSCSYMVGCTTTGRGAGAAKLVFLLSGMSPRVMIVEEARQVLEAHILASLVGTVEHIILIGDLLQLCPNINSYTIFTHPNPLLELATENPKTGKIYRFDQSLMEWLLSGGFPMNTLYPNLKDNEQVLSYPKVWGMYKNIFFVSHTHKEVGGGEDSISKHNPFEGCYNKPGNIVIFVAYLGQIPKLCKELQEIVTIVIDEQDAKLLEQQIIDQEEMVTVQKVQQSKQVTIQTLDNFQGKDVKPGRVNNGNRTQMLSKHLLTTEID
ncbi:hypothetical protein B0J17DRAFT_707621 [Rhizoctonia solani]|nr:hypothetical protein B0J17DRAFT_707621 [Rhizoctonia solani]